MLTKKKLQHMGHSLGLEEVKMCSTEPFTLETCNWAIHVY